MLNNFNLLLVVLKIASSFIISVLNFITYKSVLYILYLLKEIKLQERFGEKPVVATVFLAYLISMIILFKNFAGGKKDVSFSIIFILFYLKVNFCFNFFLSKLLHG